MRSTTFSVLLVAFSFGVMSCAHVARETKKVGKVEPNVVKQEKTETAIAAGTKTEVKTEETGTTRVESIIFSEGVENRLPVGEAEQFDISVERVYCYTNIISENVPTEIKHVWYADGKKVSEVPLNVRAANWRTWSYKTVWPAEWTVEVVDAAGEVIKTARVKVSEKISSEN